MTRWRFPETTDEICQLQCWGKEAATPPEVRPGHMWRNDSGKGTEFPVGAKDAGVIGSLSFGRLSVTFENLCCGVQRSFVNGLPVLKRKYSGFDICKP